VALASIVSRLAREWQGSTNAQIASLSRLLLAHQADLEGCFGECGAWPELVIHGDYYAENLIVRGDAIVGVVDYDLAHWCWRALEVAEALIYFACEPEQRLEHIVYSGALDLGAVERFLVTYATVIRLLDAEVRALPHLVRTIWMCAALDPPLRPRPSAQAAPQVLPEVLDLADWAQAHAAEMCPLNAT
jgi:Ser/Thr protein kinase RdoA (MazF antagonist)